MKFDPSGFYNDFRLHINSNDSRYRKINGKTANAVDTIRVFEATDVACGRQSKYFTGVSRWNGKKGEFLCDYTFRSNDIDILLSLESEWGKANSEKTNKQKVIYDFLKIVNMISPVKIMVFAYIKKEGEQPMLDAMAEVLKKRTLDVKDEYILAISCPWSDEMNGSTITGYSWNKGKWCEITY